MWALEGDLGLGRKVALQRVPTRGTGLEGCVAVPIRSRGSIITLGTGMRADPRGCVEQFPHASLDIPGESASPRHRKVGSAWGGPEARCRASATAFEVALEVPGEMVA